MESINSIGDAICQILLWIFMAIISIFVIAFGSWVVWISFGAIGIIWWLVAIFLGVSSLAIIGTLFVGFSECANAFIFLGNCIEKQMNESSLEKNCGDFFENICSDTYIFVNNIGTTITNWFV
jgi:hypothetical protein